MLKIGGRPLLVDEFTILVELRSQLLDQGIILLEKIKPSENNIQFNCPVHAEGRERRPSCGISTSNNDKVESGMVHCFTCGYTATIEEMVSYCFGYSDAGYFGREWLLQNFVTISAGYRRDFNLNLSRSDDFKNESFITEEELDSYRYTHPYMYKRRLTDEIINRFDIGYDPKFILDSGNDPIETITFPVRDISGRTLFIARRAINFKLFHYPTGVRKPIYGLFELPKDANEVVICESIFNALTCYAYGKSAIALLGLGTRDQYDQLSRLPIRKYILGLDSDPAGKAAAMKLQNYLMGKKLVTIYDIPKGKDINDLEQEEFEHLPELF